MSLASALLGLALVFPALRAPLRADDVDDRIRAYEEADAAQREARLRAVEELGSPAALRALAAFAEGDAFRRRARAEILAAIAPAEAFDPVRALLGDPDDEVRAILVRFLGSPSLGAERAAERLAELERIAREDASPRVRAEAIAWIGRAALPGSVEALERLVRATRADEALASARALAELPAARELLVALAPRIGL